MEDTSNLWLRISKLQSKPQLKKGLEEREKELAEINKKLNKESKSISFSFPNNDNEGNNDLHATLLYKIRVSQLESEIKDIREQLAKQSEIQIKEHQNDFDEWIKQRKIPQEESIINEPIYPTLSSIDGKSFHDLGVFSQDLSGRQIPSPKENQTAYKPPTRVGNSNFITIFFWVVALFLVISFLSQQGTNEKQQPKQQDYPQDVSALSSE